MKKLSKLAIALCGTALMVSATYAKQPTTFLGPTLQADFTSTLTDETAYSVFGEAGLKNLRFGGVFGIQVGCNSRVKFSAEYLRQRIRYDFNSNSFHSHNNSQLQWLGQGSFGAGYEYDIPCSRFRPTLDLNGYISSATSKEVRTHSHTFVDPRTEITNDITIQRRFAGSHTYNISPSVNFEPWCGGKVGLEANYDNVRYLNKFSHRTHTRHDRNQFDPHGFGGTARINQYVAKNIEVGVSAAVRKPFNDYYAMVAWNRDTRIGMWALGVNGDYVSGKHRLPNTYNIGLSADLYLDRKCEPCCEAKAMTQNFLGWTSASPSRVPQVLAVTERKVRVTTPLIPLRLT